MAKEYYYFVSGLPNLHLEDTKLILTPLMLFHDAKEHLDAGDYQLLRLMLLPNDILNLVNVWHDKDTWTDDSVITREEWEEIIKDLKQKAEPVFVNKNILNDSIPLFVLNYMSLEIEKLELTPQPVMMKELFTLFYDWIDQHYDGFISEWFRFDSELKNIIIALNCRKHQIPIHEQLIGNSYLTEKLLKSNASDFGLGNEYPIFDTISRLNDNPDIIEKEKGFDALRWKWLESRTFFDYFTIPRILAYFGRIRIIYRWIHLSQAVGEKRFHQVLKDLENSFEFPEEFALKR